MEATFFASPRSEAVGVSCQEDLPREPAGEPVKFESIAWLRRLSELVGLSAAEFAAPLRDATCQSFPVWELGRELCQQLGKLGDEELDAVAVRWVDEAVADADAHELSELLCQLREALRLAGSDDRLYVLLEEKAL